MPPKTNKKTYKPKKKKAADMNIQQMSKMMTKIQLKNCETKYKTIALDKQELYHNKLYNFSTNLWTCLPGQGDTDGSRDGDQINLTGLKFRLMFGQKLDRPNVTFKVYIVEYDDVLSGDPTTYADFYHNITANGLLDPVQSKRWKIRKAFTLKNSKGSVAIETANKEYVRALELWLPYRKLVNFRADASSLAVNLPQHLNIICLAYDAYGTVSLDNIGYWQGAVTAYFKDP